MPFTFSTTVDLLLGCGVLTLVTSGIQLWRNTWLSEHGGRAVGQVIDYRVDEGVSTDDDGVSSTTTTYYATIRYDTPVGVVTKECDQGSSTTYTVGQQVVVLYRKDRPDAFQIDDPTALWFGPMGMVVIGVILTGAGVYMGFRPEP